MKIANNEITGTLKYATGYTGFHGSDPTQQEGNYLALKIETDPVDTVTTVELVNGASNKGPVELDDDKLMVLRITDTANQTIKIVSKKGDVSEMKTYGLSGLTLTPKPVVHRTKKFVDYTPEPEA